MTHNPHDPQWMREVNGERPTAAPRKVDDLRPFHPLTVIVPAAVVMGAWCSLLGWLLWQFARPLIFYVLEVR